MKRQRVKLPWDTHQENKAYKLKRPIVNKLPGSFERTVMRFSNRDKRNEKIHYLIDISYVFSFNNVCMYVCTHVIEYNPIFLSHYCLL